MRPIVLCKPRENTTLEAADPDLYRSQRIWVLLKVDGLLDTIKSQKPIAFPKTQTMVFGAVASLNFFGKGGYTLRG
jgi:hypothetical protein